MLLTRIDTRRQMQWWYSVKRPECQRRCLFGSGYGVHIYWPLCEPIPESRWRECAKRLAQLFATHGLEIDTSRTQDSASILRPPGTHNRKNGACVLVEWGGIAGPYRLEDLPVESIAQQKCDQMAATPQLPKRKYLNDRIFDIQHDPPIWSETAEARLRAALAFILAVDREVWLRVGMGLHWCGWDRGFQIWDEWSRTVVADNPAKYVESDQRKTWDSFDRRQRERNITVGTIYHMAKERGWKDEMHAQAPQASIRLDADIESTRRQQERANEAHKPPTGANAMISAADLRIMAFDPVRYVVPGFVPEGLILLVGRPKVGKSWLALDLCLACAGNRAVLGAIKPLQGDVLYLALEDGKRRLQRRIDKLMSPFQEAWPERLKLVASGGWRRADQGGLDDIEAWCKSVVKPVLVVVDTLERLRKPASGKSPLYSADYEAITGLQKIAIDYGIAILVLHHDRKSEADDAFDTVSGTLGLTGAADTILIIKRRPNGIRALRARARH